MQVLNFVSVRTIKEGSSCRAWLARYTAVRGRCEECLADARGLGCARIDVHVLVA